MRALVTVNGVDAYQAACLAGLGIIQVPRLGVRARLSSGELVEVLPRHVYPPMPVSLVRGSARVRKPVRVVMDWLEAMLPPHLD